MKKPEYLTGECKTYIEYAFDRYSDYQCGTKQDITKDATVNAFYSQPFIKDMIVRPEKPEKPEKQSFWKTKLDEWNNWQPLFKGEWEIFSEKGYDGWIIEFNRQNDGKQKGFNLLFGSNTDNFIREAKKAGIKLEWK